MGHTGVGTARRSTENLSAVVGYAATPWGIRPASGYDPTTGPLHPVEAGCSMVRCYFENWMIALVWPLRGVVKSLTRLVSTVGCACTDAIGPGRATLVVGER